MKRGVIMELKDGYAVLLDGTGDMAQVSAQPQWRVGEMVEFPRRKGGLARWGSLAAALVVLLGAGVFARFYLTPYSLVSLDVNPSVELTLNRFDRVIGMRGMNDEGEELLGYAEVKHQNLEAALTALLTEEYLADYLKDDAYVTLTVQGGDEARGQALLSLMDSRAAAQVGGQVAQVECRAVNADTVQAAHGCGVTAGKYLALMELQEADPELNIEEYYHCGLSEIKTETQRCYQHAANGGGHGAGNGNGYGGGMGNGNGNGYGGGNGYGHRHGHGG